MNNPEKYGFDIKDEDLYNDLPYEEVTINGPVIDFADWAISRGINYKILKLYNPWLRESFLTNRSNKTYAIKIPELGSIEMITE